MKLDGVRTTRARVGCYRHKKHENDRLSSGVRHDAGISDPNSGGVAETRISAQYAREHDSSVDCIVENSGDNSESRPQSQVTYTAEIGRRVCEEIAMRVSVATICRRPGMPSERTLYRWRREIEEFATAYDLARAHRADARQDYIDDIARRCEMGALRPDVARVLIDAEKWQMGKENSKRYGERSDLNVNHTYTIAQEFESYVREISVKG